MFDLMRYFSLASLLALVLALAGAAWVEHHRHDDRLRDLGVSINAPLVRAIGNAMWPRYEEFMLRVADLPDDSLRAQPEMELIDRDVREMVFGIPILKIKIFNRAGRTIYSSDPLQIGERRHGSGGLQAALTGSVTTEIVRRERFSAIDREYFDVSVIANYAPIIRRNGEVAGVAEIYADLDALTWRLRQNLLVKFGEFTAGFVLLYVVLFLIVRRGDRLLRGQYSALASSSERERARNALLQREIAQREEAERRIDALSEVEAANRAMNSMIANMSHELRTPLNAIIGFSEMIEHQILGEQAVDRYSSYAGDIHRSADHLLAIINNVLDLAKVQAGKMELHEESFRVVEAIDECVAMVKPLARIKSHTIEVSIASGLTMRGDLRQLRQMLLNLLSNAVKFTPNNGDITVAAMLDEQGGLELTVADSGIGIPPQDLARALAPFVQVDDHLTRRYEGAGLGLSIVKSLVELHGGRFMLDSIVGIGTTATLRFPPSRMIPGQAAAEAA